MVLNNTPPLGENFIKTNFFLLEKDYKEILEVQPGPVTSPPQYRTDVHTVVSKRILFYDMSYLTCVEFSNQDRQLLQYYYEWYNPERNLIMKFHAHYHSEDTPEEIRKFDPFHLHKKDSPDDLKLTVREANEELRGIRQIINYIIQTQYAVKYY